MRASILAVVSALTVATLPAAAAPGDASEVLRLCGTPISEHQGISQVTNKMQRDLTYGRMILHFEPSQGGWSFLSGWDAHVPVTRSMVEERMPCVREALQVAAAEPPNQTTVSIDPTIRQQTTIPQESTSTFGIPHLWLILILSLVVVLLYVFLPGRQRRNDRHSRVEGMRRRRKPEIDRAVQRESGRGIDV